MDNTIFGYTEGQIAQFGLTFGVGAFILYMMFIVLNLALEGALREGLPGGPPRTAAEWPPAFREAAAMAILGALALDGVAPGLPGVTGRRQHAGCCCTTIRPSRVH